MFQVLSGIANQNRTKGWPIIMTSRTLYERAVMWFIEKTAPMVYDDIWNCGFEAGEEHALMCRGGEQLIEPGEIIVLAEPRKGSQWGVGSGNA